MTSIGEAFSQVATRYDSERPLLVPCFDAFYGAALGCLEFATDEPVAILDLGAGTGLLAALVAQRFPAAQFRLIDLSAEMLMQAKVRFENMGRGAPLADVGDYSVMDLGGPYNAVISGLSIHHLEDAAKKVLFRSIRRALKPGGRFVNADQVLGDDPAEEEAYELWWQRSARSLGASAEAIGAAIERMKHDRCATVSDQLGWMRDAGFGDVACVFQDHRFAVFSASRS